MNRHYLTKLEKTEIIEIAKRAKDFGELFDYLAKKKSEWKRNAVNKYRKNKEFSNQY